MSRRRPHLIACLAATLLAIGGCGSDSQPWKGQDGRDATNAGSVAPAAGAVPDEPVRPTTPGDAPSPAGTTPDGDMLGTTTPDGTPEGVRQDRAAMVLLRSAVSIIEGCKSGRQTYLDCDEQRELGERDRLGVIFSDSGAVGEVQITATPQSVRVTTRSESGARFTVARSPSGDRFSCMPGPGDGACPSNGTWTW